MPPDPSIPAVPHDAAPRPGASPLAGMGWMLLTGLLFVAVTATVKHLGARIPAPEAAFLRYLLGLIFLLPVARSLRRDWPGRRALAIFAGRGAVHAVGVMLWFFAMTQIPMAEVTAINFLNPILITLAAAALLGETLSLPRIMAVAVAFGGALVVLRPGFRVIEPGHLAMLGTASCFAASYMIAKRMSDSVSPSVVVAMLSVFVTLGLAPVAAAVWVWPSWVELGWLLLVAGFATTGHLTMTLAFRAAPITVTQPVTFLQLVWATLLGWTLFGEPLDGWVILGGAMILGAAVTITFRESRARRRLRPEDLAGA